MTKKDVEKVKGRYNIASHGQYVILFSKNLLIFHTDGSLVASRKDLRNIRKIIPISEDTILIDCGSQKSYIAISLKDGLEIWRAAHPKLEYTSRSFAISPDHTVVYDFFELGGSKFFVRIDLTTKELSAILLDEGLRCISDLACDEEGIPCLLEHHYEMIGEKHLSANGIRFIYEDSVNPGESYYWKYKWFFDFPTISKFFFGNTQTILTQDLFIYHPNTGDKYNLLENETRFQLPQSAPFDWKIVPNTQYIILIYNEMNIVVDIHTRKMVARYHTDFYHGNLIDEHYWVSTDSGVLIKPFPFIEDIPAKMIDFWCPKH